MKKCLNEAEEIKSFNRKEKTVHFKNNGFNCEKLCLLNVCMEFRSIQD